MTETARTGADGEGCERCAELEREVARLRREVAELRAKNAELLRRAAERDFERPPHYQ